jgi:hypothetical protein
VPKEPAAYEPAASDKWSSDKRASNKWASNKWASNKWASNKWASNKWASNKWASGKSGAPAGKGVPPHAAVAAMATARQRGRIAQRQCREARDHRDRGDGERAREDFSKATFGHVPPLARYKRQPTSAACAAQHTSRANALKQW